MQKFYFYNALNKTLNFFKFTIRTCGFLLIVLFLFILPKQVIGAEGQTDKTISSSPVQLTLEKAMDMSEDHSYQIKIATDNENAAVSTRDGNFLNMFPKLSATGNYLIYSKSVNKLVGTSTGLQMGLPEKVATGALTITQPIVGLYALTLALQQSAAAARMAVFNKQLAQEDARYLGAFNFVNAQKAKELLSVANSALDLSQKQLANGQARFREGELINADLLKLKLNSENALTTKIAAETTYEVAMLSLAETLGVEKTDKIILPEEYKSEMEKKKSSLNSMSAQLSESITTRNDVKSSEENYNVAHYNKLFSTGNYLPNLSFVASYSRNFKAQDISPYAKKDIQDNFYYGLQMTWEIFNWGVTQTQINAASASEHAALMQKEYVLSQAKIDTTKNYRQVFDSYQNLDSARTSVQYAKDVYAQVSAQYQSGRVTTTDVINALNDLNAAKAKYANAIGDLDLAWLLLYKSTGLKLSTK